jgi:hypothetical protein
MQHVVKVRNPSDPDGLLSEDLTSLLADFAGSGPTTTPGEVRDADEAELDAMSEMLAELRTACGLTDEVTYHVCRHDEGIGDCSAAVVVK